ncbi:hypothetical protein O9992_21050 [Vibrio lentus]|nr:hypothetical protein [Vibrio lentus]
MIIQFDGWCCVKLLAKLYGSLMVRVNESPASISIFCLSSPESGTIREFIALAI